MKIFFAIIFLFATQIQVKSQERITTDRPDQTESAWTVPKKVLQTEFGIGLENIDRNNFVLTLPDLFLRYGLAKHLEFHIDLQYLNSHQNTGQYSMDSSGLTAIEPGVAVELWDQKKILPKTSVIVRAGLPFTSTKAFKSDNMPVKILLTMENIITEHFGLGYNLGVRWDGENANPSILYSLSAGFDIGKKWEGFIEAFGSAAAHTTPLNSIDAGFGFYLNNNMKIDGYFGKRVSTAAERDFYGVGYSFRINTKHK